MARSKFPKMPKTGGGGGRGGTSTRGGGSRGGVRGGDGASINDSKAKGGFRGKGRKGRPALNTDGYPPQKGGAEFESDLLGGVTYYCEADGKTYYGQEAIDKYEEDHPGEGGPHDGITGESGMYYGDSQWHPSGGQQDQQGGWGR